MDRIEADTVTLEEPIPYYLCHTSGAVLHQPGDILTTVHRSLFSECAITTLLKVDPNEDLETIKREAGEKKISIDEIPINEPIPVSLYDEQQNVIAHEGDLFSSEVKNDCKKRSVTTLVYRKDPMELEALQVEKYVQLIKSEKAEFFDLVAASKKDVVVEEDILHIEEQQTITACSIPDERIFMYPAKMITVTACKEMMLHPQMLCIPAGDFNESRSPKKTVSGRTSEQCTEYLSRYTNWISDVESCFSNLKSNKATEFDSIDKVACGIIDLFYEDVYYCCNVLNLRQPPAAERYLPLHALNVAIVSAGIAIAMDIKGWALRELVIGALLHDIGHLMTYRPYLAQREFSSADQKKYDNHSMVGMAMLKNMNRIPISTLMVVAQHHEKIDGSGRVFHATASKIHEFAKIVGAADAFESSCRFMRPSTALAWAISQAQNKKLELKYIKALVVLLSMFPVGIAVKTKDNIVCKVVGTNGDAFRKPLLRSIYTMQDEHLFPIDKKEIIDMSKSTVEIMEEVKHSGLKSDISIGFFEE